MNNPVQWGWPCPDALYPFAPISRPARASVVLAHTWSALEQQKCLDAHPNTGIPWPHFQLQAWYAKILMRDEGCLSMLKVDEQLVHASTHPDCELYNCSRAHTLSCFNTEGAIMLGIAYESLMMSSYNMVHVWCTSQEMTSLLKLLETSQGSMLVPAF